MAFDAFFLSAVMDEVRDKTAEARVDKIDPILKSHGTKIDSLSTRLSELTYTMANKAYEARTGEKLKK